ncbi:MAG: SIR2 family protein [Polyangiaceae bacterium]|nr:SIR2 family protein [Polyangiaceae bacterium]
MATNGPQRPLGSSKDWWNRFRHIEDDAAGAPLVFIVGSALSTADGHGVPGIVETVEFIEKKYADRDLAITGDTPTERYQSAFAQLPFKVNADAPDEVVRECVLRASSLPSDDARLEKVRKLSKRAQCEACAELQRLDDWWLPRGVEFLANMVRRARARREADGLSPAAPLVVTTNFDGLIEVALRKLGVPAVAKNLPRNEYARMDPGEVCVWHVHGYWCHEPTLHTPWQLDLDRPKLQKALAQAFDGASIRVLAYGGWNDQVFEVLTQVLKDFTDAPEVLWAFYQREPADVARENAHVLEAFRTDGGMSRVVLFSGVDAHQAPDALMPPRSAIPPTAIPPTGIPPTTPSEGAGRTTVAGTKRFLDQLNELVALCPLDRRAAFERYREQAGRDEEIDLRHFVGDVCSVLSASVHHPRDFARLASDLVFRLAYCLAERMQQARELQKSGLERERYHRLPVVTYLFAEIIIAYAEERGGIAARIHEQRDKVVGQNAVIWSGADCAAHGDDALLALERALWTVLNANEGEYRPQCAVSLKECEQTKETNDGSLCNEQCHRVALQGLLQAGAFQHDHARVFVEKLSDEEARLLAHRLQQVILVQFGGSSLSREERESEVALAALIKNFIRLTQPHVGTP